MSNEISKGKCLYSTLQYRDLLGYGSVITGKFVREILEIKMPDYGTKRDFDEIILAELSAIDYVRNRLLNDGKYLTSQNGDYRILLPSENKRQVELYMKSADKKLSRAYKLSINTPKHAKSPADNHLEARLAMKRESARP
jgi:hypothetical protein